MRREKTEITISGVARRAKVTRASIQRRPELRAKIKAHQRLAPVDTTAARPAPADGDSSILAALRLRLTAKETEIAELKSLLRERERTIATLHGEIDRLTESTY